MRRTRELLHDPLTEMALGLGVAVGSALLEEVIEKPTTVIGLAIGSCAVIHALVREHSHQQQNS